MMVMLRISVLVMIMIMQIVLYIQYIGATARRTSLVSSSIASKIVTAQQIHPQQLQQSSTHFLRRKRRIQEGDGSATITDLNDNFGRCILLLGKYDIDQNKMINYTEFYSIVNHVCNNNSSNFDSDSDSNSNSNSSNSANARISINTTIWDHVFHTAACACRLYDRNNDTTANDTDTNNIKDSDCCSSSVSSSDNDGIYNDVIYRPGKYSNNYTYTICYNLYTNFIQYDCVSTTIDNDNTPTVDVSTTNVPTTSPMTNIVEDNENDNNNDEEVISTPPNSNNNTSNNSIEPSNGTSNDKLESWMIVLLTVLSVSVVSMILYIKMSSNRQNDNELEPSNTKKHNPNVDDPTDGTMTNGIAVEAIAKGSILPIKASSTSKKKKSKRNKKDENYIIIKKKKRKKTTLNILDPHDYSNNNILGIAPNQSIISGEYITTTTKTKNYNDDMDNDEHQEVDEVMIVLVTTNKTTTSEEGNNDDDIKDAYKDIHNTSINDTTVEDYNNVDTYNHHQNIAQTAVVNDDIIDNRTPSNQIDNTSTDLALGAESIVGHNKRTNYENYFNDETINISATTNDLMYSGSYQYFTGSSSGKNATTMNPIQEIGNDSSSSSSTCDDNTTTNDGDDDESDNIDENIDESSSSEYSTSSSSESSSSVSLTNNNKKSAESNTAKPPITGTQSSPLLIPLQHPVNVDAVLTTNQDDESSTSSSSAGFVSNASSMIPLVSDPLLLPKLRPTILDHGIDSVASKQSRPSTIVTTSTISVPLANTIITPPSSSYKDTNQSSSHSIESKSIISSSSLLYRDLQRHANDDDDDHEYCDMSHNSNNTNINISNFYDSDDDDIQQLLSMTEQIGHGGIDFSLTTPSTNGNSNLIKSATSLGSGNAAPTVSPSDERYCNGVSFTQTPNRLQHKLQQNRIMSHSKVTTADDDSSTVVTANRSYKEKDSQQQKQSLTNHRERQLQVEEEVYDFATVNEDEHDVTPKTTNTKVIMNI